MWSKKKPKYHSRPRPPNPPPVCNGRLFENCKMKSTNFSLDLAKRQYYKAPNWEYNWKFILVFNWNHFEMRLLNLRINFYLLQTFCPHLGSFCVVSSFTTFRPNSTSGLLQVISPRPRIGMLSLVTVFPVITAFHSSCLSHHVFDQVNL